MSYKFIFVFALLFSLALTESVSENQVLESEQPDNTQTSKNYVSDSLKDDIKLSDLLFEYLDENNKKDVSEMGKLIKSIYLI